MKRKTWLLCPVGSSSTWKQRFVTESYMAIYYENGSIFVVYCTFTSEVTAVSLHTRLTYLTNDSFAVFLLNRAALIFRGQKKLCLNPLVFVFFSAFTRFVIKFCSSFLRHYLPSMASVWKRLFEKVLKAGRQRQLRFCFLVDRSEEKQQEILQLLILVFNFVSF